MKVYCVTDITAVPIDDTTLTITGGRFHNNSQQSRIGVHLLQPGIAIRRSNVLVNSLEHRITGEGNQGA